MTSQEMPESIKAHTMDCKICTTINGQNVLCGEALKIAMEDGLFTINGNGMIGMSIDEWNFITAPDVELVYAPPEKKPWSKKHKGKFHS